MKQFSPENPGTKFMAGISGKQLTKEEAEFIKKYGIGFIILFSRNLTGPMQTAELTEQIHALNRKNPPFIFIDQEGGPVIRFNESAATVVSHMGIAATGDPFSSYSAGKIIGDELSSMGIDGVFAPVLDVNSEKANPVIGIRSFSDKKRIVAKFGNEFIRGVKESGVIACAKHFPGHGSTREDSHLALPSTALSKNRLIKTHLFPFNAVIKSGVEALMTAHVIYEKFDNKPATFSSEINKKILRDKLKFNGVLFSDCLEMAAISENFNLREIVELSVNAGVDVMSVSHSQGKIETMFEYLSELIKKNSVVKENINTSLMRIARLKKREVNTPDKSFPEARPNIEMERNIAEKSVTLFSDPQNLIPINKDSKIKILVFRGVKRTTNHGSEVDKYPHKKLLGKFFPESEFEIIPTGYKGESLIPAVTDPAGKVLIVIDHSGGGRIDSERVNLLDDLVKRDMKIIFIAAESPYILGKINPSITKIATYGSRMIQMEAMLKVIFGKIEAKGRLPVKL